MEELKWTGERLTFDIGIVYGTIEHLHRYALAQTLAQDKIVLDIASGEGYGSALISKVAKKTFGVDIDENSVIHASKKYSHCVNLQYIHGSVDDIPLPDKSVDLIVSFETIEHLTNHHDMMCEFKRVLRDGGVVILSSPEKDIYQERDPNNPFHLKELTYGELNTLIGKYFKFSKFLQQRFVIGSLITPLDDTKSQFLDFDGDQHDIKNNLKQYEFYNKAYFNLVICSDFEINQSNYGFSSIFNGVDIIEAKERKLDNLQKSNTYKIISKVVRLLNFFKK